MIRAQVLILALAAFSATAVNGAALPVGQDSANGLLVRDANGPPTLQTTFQAKRQNGVLEDAFEARDSPPNRADVSMENSGSLVSSPSRQQNASQDGKQQKQGSDSGSGSDGKQSKGNKGGQKSGPDSVASAVAAAGSASPSVTNDKGVQPLKTDKAASDSPSKTASSDNANKTGSGTSKASSSGNKGKDKAADAAPTAAPSNADASALPSPSGTWSWQAGAFGCPDNADPKGTKHACTATALSSYTGTDGAKPSSAPPAPSSSSQKSSKDGKSDSSDKSDKQSKAAVKQGGSKKKSSCSDETDEDGEESEQSDGQSNKQSNKESSKDTNTKSEQDSSSASQAAMSANDVNNGPVPSSQSSKDEGDTADESSSAPARVNIPTGAKQVNSSRVMIPLNKRSFSGTMEEKQQKWQELKAMDTQIKKLRKTLLKEKKKQEKQKNIPASKPQGSFAAKTVLSQDLKTMDNQINQLKGALIHEAKKPQDEHPAKMVVGEDLKPINSQIEDLRHALVHEDNRPNGDLAAKVAIGQDMEAINSQLNDLKHALQHKVDLQAEQKGMTKEQHPFIQTTNAHNDNMVQSGTAHNQVSAAALDEATRPRFSISKPQLCSFVSYIFASIGLIPLAVLALLRKQSNALFYGVFASLITASLATLYILENTLIYHNVLPATFSLAYLALLALQSCFALLIRTPTLSTAPKGYQLLGSMTRGEAEEEEKRFAHGA
ncbi:unnamed protein product [Sympodiomycopsis kandeliae]